MSERLQAIKLLEFPFYMHEQTVTPAYMIDVIRASQPKRRHDVNMHPWQQQ